ncbi:MAG: efflux transporter outer membrane subunit [Rhodanobacteraceae bacterium]
MSMPMFLSPQRLCAFVCVLSLVGCTSTHGLRPQGRTLDAATLQAQRSVAGVPVTPAAWPQQDWWKAFNDAQLDGLVDEALAGNPDLAAADARVRKALALAEVAGAARKPSLGALAGAAGARIPKTLFPSPTGGHFGVTQYGILDFKWDFDVGGGKRAALHAAFGQARASEVEAQAARLTLSANAVSAYAALADAYTRRDLAQQALQRAQTFQKLTAQRVRAGIDSRFQSTQIDAETADAQAQLAAADNDVRGSGIALAVLLGRGPDRALAIARPQPLPATALALPSDLPVELLGRRPDVVAARWRVEAAASNIKFAKAAFLPDVSITALAGLVAGPGASLLQASAGLYSIAPALSLPIFEGGKLRGNLAGKDADYDLAVAQYNKTVIDAINEVAEYVDDLRALDVQSAREKQSLTSAQQAYALAMQRYRGGVGNYLEALTVRSQLLDAERRLAALRIRRAGAAVQLIEALGGGFEPDTDASAIVTHTSNNRRATP